MDQVVIQLRAMQLFYHQAHHLVHGDSFVGDHELFNKLYLELEDEYDVTAERVVSHYSPDHLNLAHILVGVSHILEQLPNLNEISTEEIFELSLHLEKSLCGNCASTIQQGVTEGTRQLLGDLCNHSEIRQYKLHQRIR